MIKGCNQHSVLLMEIRGLVTSKMHISDARSRIMLKQIVDCEHVSYNAVLAEAFQAIKLHVYATAVSTRGT